MTPKQLQLDTASQCYITKQNVMGGGWYTEFIAVHTKHQLTMFSEQSPSKLFLICLTSQLEPDNESSFYYYQ